MDKRASHLVSKMKVWVESQTQRATRSLADCLYGDAELHAMVLHADADAPLVQDRLLPILRRAGVRVAAMPDVLPLGFDTSTAMAHSLAKGRRFLVMVSQELFAGRNQSARLASSAMLQRRGDDLRSGGHSIIPLYVEDPETLTAVPASISGLIGMSFSEATSPPGVARLVKTLVSPEL